MIPVINEIKVPIVPSVTQYYELLTDRKPDLQAICCFAAIGFFLDEDTYFTNQKAFRPGTTYTFDSGNVLRKQRHFQWHYSPREITFRQAQEEFAHRLEAIVKDATQNKKVVIPISGGLDSRTLAVTLAGRNDVFAYSYEFEDGIPENRYGRAVAEALSFPYKGFTIQKGYLWNVIMQIAQINKCYSDFINPRQMAIWQRMSQHGEVFLLGHGGDLFFDGMGVDDHLPLDEQHDYLVSKLIRPVGLELGNDLWTAWGLTGSFQDFLISRILELLEQINIPNANARLRAFKTEYYVSRWTAVNLEVFQRQLPIVLPFFDDAICRFICTVPERHLAGRKLEIEYLKSKSPAVSAIPWQKYFPCNLYNYEYFNTLPVKIRRALIKGKRELKTHVSGKRSDTSAWELQFLGAENNTNLRSYLFDESFARFIPRSLVEKFYSKFQQEPRRNVHAVNMLLTLSLFNKLYLKA